MLLRLLRCHKDQVMVDRHLGCKRYGIQGMIVRTGWNLICSASVGWIGVLGGRQIVVGDWIFFTEWDSCLDMLEVMLIALEGVSVAILTQGMAAGGSQQVCHMLTGILLLHHGCRWLESMDVLDYNYNINVVSLAFTSYSLSVIMYLIQWWFLCIIISILHYNAMVSSSLCPFPE